MSADPPLAYDPATLAFYDATAEVYVASGAGGVSRHLQGFLQALPPGARILDLGCGGGRDAAAMLAAGHDVEAVDASPEIARRAEARIGRPVRVMRFDELDAVARYDAVWASASLLHVPREALAGALRSIFVSLRPGGLHFASYKGGGVEGRDRHRRYFNYLAKPELVEAYQRSSPWRLDRVVDYVGGGFEGEQGPWTALTATRPR